MSANPLYFMPDTGIEDSDILGYGDLIFDDGSRQFINGDPDIASSYPGAPQNDQAAPISSVVPMPDIAGGMDMDAGAGPLDTNYDPSPMPPAPIPGTPYAVDPATGNISQGGAMAIDPGQMGASMPPAGGQSLDAAAPPPASMPSSVPIPGTNHVVDPSTGTISPAGQGAPTSGFGSGGMLPYQREGALPADMAARQSAEMARSNDSLMQATLGGRETEEQVYRMAALKRQGELDAEKQSKQDELKEQQAKAARLNSERTQLADMEIKTDLLSANGAIGSLFAILGAGVLGYVHSDAGLRMIDASIDNNIRAQVSRRDSKLHVLADQLNSTEQAIAAGKSELYKIAADRVQTMQDLTKADAFAAQTPQIAAQLAQKSLAQQQEFERLSLGKTIERAPVAPKVGAAQLNQVAKYGEAASDQTKTQSDIQRAANVLGLEGWDPKTKTFKNRDAVLKEGISGVGTTDTFANDLSRVPGVGHIFHAADNLVTSEQGLKVKAALESLVAAEAKRQNPGRAPTDADRDAARLSLGALSEEGVVEAVERLMGAQEQEKARNVAAFGPEAAGTYEGRIDAQGARSPQPGGPIDQGQPLEPGRAREQLEQEKKRAPAERPGASNAGPVGGPAPADLTTSIQAHAEAEGLNPVAVQKVIGHESGGQASAVNPLTGKHAGLIQFSKKYWPDVARSAGRPDVTWAQMQKMTPEQQLPFVMAYFRDKGLTEVDTPGDYAMAAFMPAFRDKPDNFVLGDPNSDLLLGDVRSNKVWQQNPGLRGSNGLVTVGSVKRSVGG